MRRPFVTLAALLGIAIAAPTCTPAPAHADTMQAFTSDKALQVFLAQHAASARESKVFPPPIVATPAPPAPVIATAAASVVVTGTRAAQPNITNTQEVSGDEGGIVKVHGRHLVVLRRGRLFTVAVGDHSLSAINRIDASSATT